MQLSADRTNLQTLLAVSEQQFVVPPYQRPYAWGADEIEDFWDDLMATLGTGHFMGSLVLSTDDENRPLVIDGQQRLTTACLLLAALRDEYEDLDSKLASRPQNYLVANPFDEGDGRFKLRIGDANWLIFRDFVLRESGDPQRRQWTEIESLPSEVQARNRALVENATRLRQLVHDFVGDLSGEGREDKLEILERTVARNLTFVAIKVGSVADAFLLFETLNDRGLQLSAADLLKSHLLGRIAAKSGSQAVEEAADEWDDLLNDLGGDVDVTRFLRHYLLIKYQSVRKDEVFDRFKDDVADQGPTGVLQKLREVAPHYGDFEHPARVQDEEVAAVLKDLTTLRAVACYPALMPARRWLSKNDFVGFARLLEVLTFRYSSVVGLGTNDLERQYHKVAKVLEDSQGTELEKARALVIEMIPPTELFLESFQRLTMGVQYLVRYTLRRIEEHLAKSLEKEIKQDAQVHIEHIMPQSLSDEWVSLLGDRAVDFAANVNRWGNLTLLYYSLNIKASNAAFRVKKREYQKSEVELTRLLCDFATWDLEAIEARQRWLGELADRIWSVEAVDTGSAELPAHAAPTLDLAKLLQSKEWTELKLLCIETSADEVSGLSGRIDAYVAFLESEADGIDLDKAKHVSEVLHALVDDSPGFNAHHRALLRGAVEYFVMTNDALDDVANAKGLNDDVRVVTAVAQALGRPDLTIN